MNTKDILSIIRLPFRKEKELYYSLKKIIGFYPDNIDYYKQALIHKSSGKRNDKGRPVNNERLEFLGDAVLDAIVGDIVYRHFEGKREGFLTNTRSKIVQRETLNKLAQEMGIVDLIQATTGKNNAHNSYMGGNAFEALVGAIYLDRGYDACMRFMERQILDQLLNIDKVAYKEVNFKSKLIEWTQKNRVGLDFKTEEDKDKKGTPVFKSRVLLEGIEGGTGDGFSKKESQQKAAKETLSRLRKEPQFIDKVFQAKSQRTKMEETPVALVDPNIFEGEPTKERRPSNRRNNGNSRNEGDNANNGGNGRNGEGRRVESRKAPKSDATDGSGIDLNDKEYDLSEIRMNKRSSREDIIAAAEQEAFEQ